MKSAFAICSAPTRLLRVLPLAPTASDESDGANKGRPCQFSTRTRWAARVAQFWRFTITIDVMKSLVLITVLVLVTLQSMAAEIVQGITTELTLAKTHFTNTEPIIVDVYVENSTTQDVHMARFSPLSSSVGLPSFVFVRVSDGKEFSLPPGLFGDDWDAWYQPTSGRDSFQVGDFVLPAHKRVHLLHGDLRETVVRAGKHCQKALDEERVLMDRPDNASTKKEYEETVRFADDFLRGGIYDIRVWAYSTSPTVRISIESRKK